MKLLITSEDLNPLVTELSGGLRDYLDVKTSIQSFWEMKEVFQIIHIQWPEELFGWRVPSELDLMKLQLTIALWKKCAKIVVTRHNTLPNHSQKEQFEELYRIIYDAADAVIHLGSFSVDEFKGRYRFESFSSRVRSVVIPHPIYQSYSNSSTRSSARKQLRIPLKSQVVLCFGSIRSANERRLILRAFSELRCENKFLLAPRFYGSVPSFFRQPAKWMREIIPFILLKLRNDVKLDNKFIPSGDVQYYFNSADVVFVPRVESLNSGVVPLSFFFKKVVVGPSIGNIKEMLLATKNPVYSVDCFNSIPEAILEGLRIAKMGLGEDNSLIAEKLYNLRLVISELVAVYKELLGEDSKK